MQLNTYFVATKDEKMFSGDKASSMNDDANVRELYLKPFERLGVRDKISLFVISSKSITGTAGKIVLVESC